MIKLFGFLILLGLLVKYWWVVVLGLLVWAAVMWLQRLDVEAGVRREWAAGLAARADQQHQQVMCGDDRGVYGMYPPEMRGKWAT